MDPTYFWIITQIIGIIILILTLVHIFVFAGGFGGRSNPKQEFNWHVLLMMVCFTPLMGSATMAFREFQYFKRPTRKLIHMVLFGACIIFSLIGLFFIIDVKDLSGHKHFQSYHSWLGIFTMALLVAQFSLGFYAYWTKQASPSLKQFLMPWHIKIGIGIFFLWGVTIITGIDYAKRDAERFLKNCIGGLILIFLSLVAFRICDKPQPTSKVPSQDTNG